MIKCHLLNIMKYLFACDYLLINKLIIAAAWVVEYNSPFYPVWPLAGLQASTRVFHHEKAWYHDTAEACCYTKRWAGSRGILATQEFSYSFVCSLVYANWFLLVAPSIHFSLFHTKNKRENTELSALSEDLQKTQETQIWQISVSWMQSENYLPLQLH